MYNTEIWQLYILRNAHHDKCNYCLTSYKVIPILWTIFLMLYFSSLWFAYTWKFVPLHVFHLFLPIPQPPRSFLKQRSDVNRNIYKHVYTHTSEGTKKGSKKTSYETTAKVKVRRGKVHTTGMVNIHNRIWCRTGWAWAIIRETVIKDVSWVPRTQRILGKKLSWGNIKCSIL